MQSQCCTLSIYMQNAAARVGNNFALPVKVCFTVLPDVMSFNNLLSTYFGLHLTCQHLSIHMCAAHRCVKAYHNNSILPHAHPVSTWHVWVIHALSGTIAKSQSCCCCAAKDVGDTLAYPADLLYIRVSAIEIRSIQADDCLICKLVWLHLVLLAAD